jgi:aspartyl-tRNA(Asn)/glutamyl-tRNA(Gln) amidotransferase subunit A
MVELYARRIEKLSDSSRAFISLDLEHACEQAAVIDATADNDTPLSGIPYACKDLFDVHGVATTGGSRVLDDNVAQQDAEAVARMNRAGAIFLGKNNLHEFAYGATGENEIYGTPPNPYDATRLAGGSSSGSAAALGYGLCAAALGTDTGGSVRAPAALCGLVGFKPTFGRISTEGVIPYSWSLDHVGTLTRSAADAAILFETLAADNRKAEFTSLDKLTIGVPDAFFFERCEGEILDGLERLMAFLRAAGAKLKPVVMPCPVLSQPLPRAARQFIQPGFSCRAGAGPVPARRAVYSRQTFRRKLPPRYEPPVRGRRHDTHAGNAGDSATHRRGRGRG